MAVVGVGHHLLLHRGHDGGLHQGADVDLHHPEVMMEIVVVVLTVIFITSTGAMTYMEMWW